MGWFQKNTRASLALGGVRTWRGVRISCGLPVFTGFGVHRKPHSHGVPRATEDKMSRFPHPPRRIAPPASRTGGYLTKLNDPPKTHYTKK